MKAHKVCMQIVDHLIAEGYRHQVRRSDLEKAIMHVRGVDPRTINKWIRALVIFDYILPTVPPLYKLNPIKIPELWGLLKNIPQTKIQ